MIAIRHQDKLALSGGELAKHLVLLALTDELKPSFTHLVLLRIDGTEIQRASFSECELKNGTVIMPPALAEGVATHLRVEFPNGTEHTVELP